MEVAVKVVVAVVVAVVVLVVVATGRDDGGRVAGRRRGLVRAELVVARQRRVGGARSIVRHRRVFRSSRHIIGFGPLLLQYLVVACFVAL